MDPGSRFSTPTRSRPSFFVPLRVMFQHLRTDSETGSVLGESPHRAVFGGTPTQGPCPRAIRAFYGGATAGAPGACRCFRTGRESIRCTASPVWGIRVNPSTVVPKTNEFFFHCCPLPSEGITSPPKPLHRGIAPSTSDGYGFFISHFLKGRQLARKLQLPRRSKRSLFFAD